MDISLKNFKLNDEGVFSITRPYESKQIVRLVDEFVEDGITGKIITDATACMGGDLVNFSKRARMVNGIEVDPENFNLLIENAKRFNCQNVNLFCQDYLQIYKKLKQDIIYIDPPWGGVGYKTKETVYLKVGNIDLWKLVRNIKELSLARYVFIKVPINVALDYIPHDIIQTVYNKSRVSSFKLICIKNN